MIAYTHTTVHMRHAIGDSGPWQFTYASRPKLAFLPDPPPRKGKRKGKKYGTSDGVHIVSIRVQMLRDKERRRGNPLSAESYPRLGAWREGG